MKEVRQQEGEEEQLGGAVQVGVRGVGGDGMGQLLQVSFPSAQLWSGLGIHKR